MEGAETSSLSGYCEMECEREKGPKQKVSPSLQMERVSPILGATEMGLTHTYCIGRGVFLLQHVRRHRRVRIERVSGNPRGCVTLRPTDDGKGESCGLSNDSCYIFLAPLLTIDKSSEAFLSQQHSLYTYCIATKRRKWHYVNVKMQASIPTIPLQNLACFTQPARNASPQTRIATNGICNSLSLPPRSLPMANDTNRRPLR